MEDRASTTQPIPEGYHMIHEIFGRRPKPEHDAIALANKNRELLAELKNERNLRRALERALAALEERQ